MIKISLEDFCKKINALEPSGELTFKIETYDDPLDCFVQRLDTHGAVVFLFICEGGGHTDVIDVTNINKLERNLREKVHEYVNGNIGYPVDYVHVKG